MPSHDQRTQLSRPPRPESGPCLELVAEPAEEELEEPPTLVHRTPRRRNDEPTQPFDFDPPTPRPDEKLVIGYLTMEQNGLFADLSVEEQERVA
jgi:hypothetical protein